MVPTRPACHWFEESCQNTAAATTQVHPAPCQSRPSKVKVVERQKQRRTGSDRPAPSAALLCRASLWRLCTKTREYVVGQGWMHAQHVIQSVDACTTAANCHGEARANRPFSLGRARASNMLGRGLHIQGTRWHGLLLFMVNSPSLRVTAAPRKERQICLVGPSRGVGFAHLGLRTDPR